MKKGFISFLLLFSALRLLAVAAPDFTITTSDGIERKLYMDYINQGKILVVEAFFTTCPPCSTHAPFYQTLYQEMQALYPGKVEFMLLSTLGSDTNTKVAQYKVNKNLSMPGAGNNGGSLVALQPYINGQFGEYQGTPTFFLIAANTGEVHFDIRGGSPQETMDMIEALIGNLLPKECTIKSVNGNPLLQVNLMVDAPLFDTAFTADNKYTLSNIPALFNATYTIKGNILDNPLNGVSTYDLLLMSKHILGIESFQQNWQIIAADFNCNGSITNFDILQARKLILGLSTDAPCGSWTLLPQAPGTDTTMNGSCLDFTGIKLGDVNSSFLLQTDDRNVLSFVVSDQEMEKGKTYTIPVYADFEGGLEGFQLDMQATKGISLINIEGLALPNFNEEHYTATPEGRWSVSYNNLENTPCARGQALFQMTIKALENTRLSQALSINKRRIPAEIYLNKQPIAALSIEWLGEKLSDPQYLLSPNPFRDQFSLEFEAENNESGLVQLFDGPGKLVYQQKCTIQKGKNIITVRPEISVSGLFFVKLNGKFIGKAIRRE